MVVFKVFNCVHQKRPNQNVTLGIWKDQYQIETELVDEDFIMKHFDLLTPGDVSKQGNTKIKILNKR